MIDLQMGAEFQWVFNRFAILREVNPAEGRLANKQLILIPISFNPGVKQAFVAKQLVWNIDNNGYTNISPPEGSVFLSIM